MSINLPNGTVRGSGGNELPDMTGDGNARWCVHDRLHVVVPNGNIIYANADAVYNALDVPAETP